jgi:hypothetical protein
MPSKTWCGFLDAPKDYFTGCRDQPQKHGRCRGIPCLDPLVTILIDDPRWPAHGRLWAHLVSDSDLDELHAFAAANGIPSRGFDRDHYDVPEEAHARLIDAGAQHVDGHELVRRLIASGLRVTAKERRGLQ